MLAGGQTPLARRDTRTLTASTHLCTLQVREAAHDVATKARHWCQPSAWAHRWRQLSAVTKQPLRPRVFARGVQTV